jgi:sporulation protein YqfC
MDNPFDVLEDFDIKVARILVSGTSAIIDNVKKIIIMSDSNITVDYGRGQLSLYGSGLTIEYIYDGRISVKGNFSGVEFFSSSNRAEA